jgi:LCP family protein required for cell wall assembly
MPRRWLSGEVVMSENWPGNWYREDEPGQPDAGGRSSSGHRARPGFTPNPQSPGSGSGDKWGNGSGSPTYGPSAAGASGSAWAGQPPSRSGYGGGGSGTRGWRRWLRPRRILTIIGVLVVVIIVATVGLYFSLNSKLTRINVLAPTSLTSAGTNWLIAGSDSRGGLTPQQENELALGRDITGGRSDTIMLLHIPANGTRPTLVSLPRDSYLPIPGHGDNKINAAYAIGGPKLLIETVQNATGLPINHFMSIGFDGLVNVVDDIGGVRMCLPAPMKDPKAGLNLKAGCQNLNGNQALGFVRTRAFSEGDLQREQDQRILLKGILAKMTSAGTLINPFAVIPAASGAAAAISVDQGTGLSQLVAVAFALRNPVTTTVPFGGFANTNAGSVVEWNAAAAKQFFSDLANDRTLPKDLISSTSVQATT